jgi:hypothetical protein
MNNVTAVANEELVIQCHVSGFPVASVTWTRGKCDLAQNTLLMVKCNSMSAYQKLYDK